MNAIYLYISSTDSLSIHPDNTSYDFTVELRENLTREYLIALTEFNCDSINEKLYVFCDIIDSSNCKDQLLPVLRVVREQGEFHNLHYYRSSRSSIQRITISIRNSNLEIPTNQIGEVSCTLRLIPI